MSNIQRLFELIRREDVVLWIGAGFSKYAGYPIGNSLSQTIYSNLSEEDKKETDTNKGLQEVSEDLVNLRNGSKAQLIEILREVYSKEPISMQYHNILATIPHIKTIITTNYDTLIETAYGSKCLKITSDIDVPSIKPNTPTIVKIHSDFSCIDKLVITKSDYTSFYNNNLDTPIWHLVKERISTKTIVFLGYALDDQNIKAIFNNITSILGSKKKESFFISPNISKLKQNELIRGGINYINLTGEDFITQLQENIDKNILFDIQKGITSVDTVNEYVKRRNMYLGLKPSSTGYNIMNVNPITGSIKHNFSFTVNDRNTIEKIANHSLEEVVITPESITNINYDINGLTHPLSDLTNLKKIILMPVSIKTTVNFYIENEQEFTDIPLKIFQGKGEVKFVISLKSGEIIIYLRIPSQKVENDTGLQVSVIIKHKDKGFSKPNDEILFYELALSLCSTKQVRLLTENGFDFTLMAPNNDNSLKEENNFLQYFKGLKLIERYYGVIFNQIENITERDKHNVRMLTLNINGNMIEEEDNGKYNPLTLGFYGLTRDMKEKIMNDSIFKFYDTKYHIIDLHGHKIKIGYRYITVNNPIYKNKEDFLSNEESDLLIECKTGSCFVRFDNNENLDPYEENGLKCIAHIDNK